MFNELGEQLLDYIFLSTKFQRTIFLVLCLSIFKKGMQKKQKSEFIIQTRKENAAEKFS